jgi:hypothetical protein
VRLVLATIFLIIFSFQILPVKAIGKILFKGTMTEEIHEQGHSGDECPNKLKKNTEYFSFTETKATARIEYLSQKISTAIHLAESLPLHHVPDIFAPPPNRA